MIVCRAREGHKDSSFPRCSDFGDRAGAGAAQQQIGTGKGLRHLIDERHHLGRDAGLQISCLRIFVIALTGLMDDMQSRQRLPQSGE